MSETVPPPELPPIPQVSSQQGLISLLASEAALLGAITVLGYTATYVWALGYAGEVGIPGSLVTVSTEYCLLMISTLAIASVPLLFVINAVVAFLTIGEGNRTLSLFKTFAMEFATIIGVCIAGYFFHWFWFLALPFLVYLAVWSLWLLFTERQMPSRIHNPVAATINAFASTNLSHRIGFPIWKYAVLTFVTLSLANSLGQFWASIQEDNWVNADNRREVLLLRSGDLLIFRTVGEKAVTLRVMGSDPIPPLIFVHTGSMILGR